MVGKTLGSYKILEHIGAGGMGEVYRARDEKLDRDVAIKMLPDEFAQDPGRLDRFEREAKLLAALNHPNIAVIHGLEEVEGLRFLALELVEGPGLDERLARGPLEVDEALSFACQIARALEAAHAKGIVHRDVKPANVKLTPSGQVKVLDFRLAKALSRDRTGGPVARPARRPSRAGSVDRAGRRGSSSVAQPQNDDRSKPMKSTTRLTVVTALLCIFGVLEVSSAQDEVVDTEATVAAAQKAVPDPTSFVSQHSGRFHGEDIEYTVTAGETYLKDKDGEPKAAIFTFAYTKNDVAEGEVRPVTFVWNGGPGSASLWLHMGTFGPRRVSVPSDAGHPGTPPYPMVDAPETILDVTDLVFVDPVGTGFSKALGEHESKEFWGLTEDAQSIAEFIRDWVTEHGRWNSPRFLLGESFGTTRAAAVANILEGRFMLSLNGIVFVSQALDYAGSSPYVRDNLISYVTYVPTMAATALYHDRIDPAPQSLEAFLRDARDFATDELLPALFKGNTLDRQTRDRVRDRLAHFTGLSPEYVERADLRVDGGRFLKELLREQGLATGRLDSRYTRDDIDDLATGTEGDAASDAISAAFKAALMDYMYRDLEVRWDRLYQAPADPDLGSEWRWQSASAEPWPVNTARNLSAALRTNPRLRVLVAAGYYDFATPFFDAEYTLNRHGIPADRIDYKYYEGGHMMYVNEPSRAQLLKDVRGFIEAQLRD